MKFLKNKVVKKSALVLLTAGALNWGATKFLNYNIVDTLLGVDSTPSKVIYSLVTLSAGYAVYLLLTKQLK